MSLSALPAENACECGRRVELSKEGRLTESGALKICLACGCGYLWIEKDFSIGLGCFIILIGVVVSTGLFALGHGQEALFFLLGIAGADMIVYFLTGRRTVCYQCDAVYRRFPLNPAHKAYELRLGAKYKDDQA